MEIQHIFNREYKQKKKMFVLKVLTTYLKENGIKEAVVTLDDIYEYFGERLSEGQKKIIVSVFHGYASFRDHPEKQQIRNQRRNDVIVLSTDYNKISTVGAKSVYKILHNPRFDDEYDKAQMEERDETFSYFG
jgi:hypothetical protein